MSNILEYKGYYSKIEYIAEDGILFGKIEGINDLVTFQSDKASEIKNEFINAVEDYLTLCEELGKEPNKSYKGTFNIRIKPELHRQISLHAIKNNNSLNNEIEKAIEFYLSNAGFEIKFEEKFNNLYSQLSKQANLMWSNIFKSDNYINFTLKNNSLYKEGVLKC
ncbi:MAG: type II toxin-antitoxin system HicB family antitoxin [Peptococcales bacterium]|jgi:predicted HicB family RNase H-like nuclease